MAVAGPIVAEDPLLGRGFDVLETRGDMAVCITYALPFGQSHRALEDVQRGSGVAAGERDEVVERIVGQGNPAIRSERAGQTTLGVGEGPPDDRRDVVVGQRLESPDAHPRQERGVDLEVRVLRRCADERDRSVLDVREQRVLLGLVEPMDLVEEQDRSLLVQCQPVLRFGDRRHGPPRPPT